MENLLSTVNLVFLIILLPLAVVLYPVMGVVFLFKYFKTKMKKFLLPIFFLLMSPLLFVLSLLVDIDILQLIFAVLLFLVLPMVLGIIFIKKYSKTKIKKYRLLGLGYFLIPLVVFFWGLISFLYYVVFFDPDDGMNYCYVPPPSSLPFNNTLSPELTSYKESLADKFAGSLPENVVEKISKK